MPIFQSLHQQLQDALEEQESLKVQIAEYARQVARVEELLAQKVGSPQLDLFVVISLSLQCCSIQHP